MPTRQAPTDLDLLMLDRAARRGLRGHGLVEPNPMVGCVGVDADGICVGEAHHRVAGGPHAERILIERHGDRLRNGTIYITLEPCTHHGRTPPCTDAIIDAGIRRVVIGCLDPNPEASGGVQLLRSEGIEVDIVDHAPSRALSAIFRHRVTTGLPWVMAKWAQTLDGRIAARTGHSTWISGERSRRLVHRQRGRVDAILTGIGTVLADDPLLTARDVRHRRIARRVVIDPDLRIPPGAALLRSLDRAPLTIACSEAAASAHEARRSELVDAGVDVLPLPTDDGSMPLVDLLIHLSGVHNCSTVLTEAGPGVLSSLAAEGLINEALVFIAPMLLGDERGIPPLHGTVSESIRDATPLRLRSVHRRDDDLLLNYGVSSPPVDSP